MEDSQFEEQTKIKMDIDARYHTYINDLMLFRLRLIVSIGVVFHLAFIFIDYMAYPDYTSIFLKIRVLGCAPILIIVLLSFMKGLKRHIIWLADAAPTFFILTISMMTAITDGTSSRYYEGANLIFLGYSIINPFYLKHLIVGCIAWIGIYEISMLCGHGHFNLVNFTFANYFMISTATFVILLAKFYKDQHYNAFVRQEHLKINEETLTALYSQADKLSKTDTLTAVNNRRHFSDMLNKKMENAESAKSTFYLVIFDVDFFKNLNDTYGHTFGDQVLVKVVEVVKLHSRPYDFIGRFGGDEFVICLDIPTKEGILNRLQRIRNGVRSINLNYQGKEVPVAVSIGAAKFIPGTQMTEAKLIEKADFELFNVKKTGRGEVSIDQ